MRRLVLLLLAIVGTFGFSPVAPARAHATTAHHAALPGGCHDQGQPAGHVCVGCAVAPDSAAMPLAVTPVRICPQASVPATLAGRRTGFDPPPPRRAA